MVRPRDVVRHQIETKCHRTEGGLCMEVGLNARQNVTEGYKQEEGPVPTLPQLMEVLSVREIQARRGSATWTRVL